MPLLSEGKEAGRSNRVFGMLRQEVPSLLEHTPSSLYDTLRAQRHKAVRFYCRNQGPFCVVFLFACFVQAFICFCLFVCLVFALNIKYLECFNMGSGMLLSRSEISVLSCISGARSSAVINWYRCSVFSEAKPIYINWELKLHLVKHSWILDT